MKPPRPEILRPIHWWIFHPLPQGAARALENFEPNRLLILTLQHRCPFFDPSGCHDIDNFRPHKVTAAQFAIDDHIEQSTIAMVLCQFQSALDRTHMFGLQRPFLAKGATLFPSGAKWRMTGKFGFCMTVSPTRHAIPHRQPDVDTASYHEMLRCIQGRLRAHCVECCPPDRALSMFTQPPVGGARLTSLLRGYQLSGSIAHSFWLYPIGSRPKRQL